VIVHDLGLIEYAKALKIQEATRDAIIADEGDDTLLVCEHPKVITVGRAIGSAAEVFSKDIPVFEVTRGGRATIHLPGQVVVYPILDLKKRERDLHGYMRKLEEAIIVTLGDFRINATRVEGKTGVWVGDGSRKIASLGIAVKKWVSYHGIALNVTCDLSVFKAISPCGFESNVMTSADRELGEEYRKVWGLEPERLFKNTKTRLIENLITELGVE
jgi:lipoyl(octanoyl) transferase